jgi:hypothetical protein
MRWNWFSGATPNRTAPTLVLQGFADGRSIFSVDAGAPKELAAKVHAATRYAAKISPQSWTAEWSVPLQTAGIPFQPGLTLGFNLGARRLETNDWLVWAGTTRENWQLNGAGRIVLDAK